MGRISVKRVYDPPASEDGARILVDRLWPRGLSKQKAAIDFWAKDLAPTSDLRKWFNHNAAKWDEFKKKYRAELQERSEAMQELLKHYGDRPLTLLYAAKDRERNHALVLREVLDRQQGKKG